MDKKLFMAAIRARGATDSDAVLARLAEFVNDYIQERCEHRWVADMETCLTGGMFSSSQHWHPKVDDAKAFEHDHDDFASLPHSLIFCGKYGMEVNDVPRP